MNKTETKKTSTKRLTLTRQTLRTLTRDELRLVAGGVKAACTHEASGCNGAPTRNLAGSRSCGSACLGAPPAEDEP